MLKVHDFPICDNTKIEVMRSGLKTVLSPSAKPTTDIVITAKFQKVSATDNVNTTAMARQYSKRRCQRNTSYILHIWRNLRMLQLMASIVQSPATYMDQRLLAIALGHATLNLSVVLSCNLGNALINLIDI